MSIIRKEQLKEKAAKEYKLMKHYLDSVDCGGGLLRELSPSYVKAEDSFIETMKELAKIDIDAEKICIQNGWI